MAENGLYTATLFHDIPFNTLIDDPKEMKYFLSCMVVNTSVDVRPWGDEVSVEFIEVLGKEYARKLFGLLHRKEDHDMTIHSVGYFDGKFTSGFKLEHVVCTKSVDEFKNGTLHRTLVFEGERSILTEGEIIRFKDHYFKSYDPDSNPTLYKRLFKNEMIQGPIQKVDFVNAFNY